MLGLSHRLPSFAERAALALGYFDANKADWGRWQRLVFVCTGNICRSPFAEGFARVQGLPARSCGIDTRSDYPADPSAIAEAARRGIDLRAHRTTCWDELELERTDLLIAIQLKHAYAIRQKANSTGCGVILMSSLLLPDFQIVRDPYGRDVDAFVTAFNQIERAVGRIQELSRRTQSPETRSIGGTSCNQVIVRADR